ncbi:hypothetical protein [Haloferula sp. A504]|uniref:hypothetical protein n=1 Tax=Haloferula sp. A504 TaxID=3373601 RepID=UPI0031BC8BED|nr:hypothetical protein [Verrucomicrobiaceae bacterium E54]
MNEQEPSGEKPRGVEVRVIGGEPPAGWERMEDPEEVVRLVKSGVKGARRVDELEPADGDEQEYRSRRKGWSVWKWTLVMGGSILVLVAASVAILVAAREDDRPGRELYGGVEVTYEVGEDPNDPFVETATRQLGEAREMVARLAAADDGEEVSSLFRDEPGIRVIRRERWKPPALDEERIAQLNFEMKEGGEGREWMVLSGKDSLLRPLRFVFVSEDDELLFDWGASVGANAPGLADFRESAPGAEADFRVEVQPDHFYTSDFPEDRYRCYKLADVFADAFAWGYVPIGSAVAEAVAGEMHLEGTILESEPMSRMLVRLRNVGTADRGQFELIEVVAADWIRWEDD